MYAAEEEKKDEGSDFDQQEREQDYTEEPNVVENQDDPLLHELKDIARGEAYIGSLSQVDVAFNRIENVSALSRIHNLITLTLICTST